MLNKVASGIERYVPGAQRPRHIKEIGEGASTALYCDAPAQRFVQRFPGCVWRMLSVSVLLLCAGLAMSEGIVLQSAEVRYTEEGYKLLANYDIQLPSAVEEALRRGVTLYFVSEFAITRSRWYWFDTDVLRDEQVIRLSFNALTQQYRLARGTLFQSFRELKDALRAMGHQTSSLVPRSELDQEGGGFFTRMLRTGSQCCQAEARMRLDVSQLPKPLQVNALINEDWNLESTPYQWSIQPVQEAAP